MTVKPTKEFYTFTKTLKNKDYDVYIVIDTNGYMIPDYDGYIPIIEITNYNCELRGFKNTLYYSNNKACARDKALYYFSMSKTPFKHLWMIEEDVFIPNTTIISSIDAKYPDGDLLCKDNKIISNVKQTYEWHWPKTKPYLLLQLPWACSLICAIRISPKLLGCIATYAKTYSTLFLDEALFNTIAIHNRLSIKKIDELSKLEFDKRLNIDEITDKYLYHPVKNFQDQQFLRQHIANKASAVDTTDLVSNNVTENDYTKGVQDTMTFQPVLENNNSFNTIEYSSQDTYSNFTNVTNVTNDVQSSSISNSEVRDLKVCLDKAMKTMEFVQNELASVMAKLSKLGH